MVKDNDEMSSLIRDYNETGPQVLSQYLQQQQAGGDGSHDDDDDDAIYTEIDRPDRKVRGCHVSIDVMCGVVII